MQSLVDRIGRKRLGLIVVVIVAGIVDQLAGTDLLSTVLPMLLGAG